MLLHEGARFFTIELYPQTGNSLCTSTIQNCCWPSYSVTLNVSALPSTFVETIPNPLSPNVLTLIVSAFTSIVIVKVELS